MAHSGFTVHCAVIMSVSQYQHSRRLGKTIDALSKKDVPCIISLLSVKCALLLLVVSVSTR